MTTSILQLITPDMDEETKSLVKKCAERCADLVGFAIGPNGFEKTTAEPRVVACSVCLGDGTTIASRAATILVTPPDGQPVGVQRDSDLGRALDAAAQGADHAQKMSAVLDEYEDQIMGRLAKAGAVEKEGA